MKTKTASIFIPNFTHNINAIRSLYPSSVKMCIPVKAQAYGHGAVVMAKEAISSGVEYLAVATAEEGCELRSAGISSPILLLGIADVSEFESIVRNNLICFVHAQKYAAGIQKTAAEQGITAHVHIKIDTGMGRIGCEPEEAPHLAEFIRSCDNLSLEGFCTHLSVSDSLKEEDKAYTKVQIQKFSQAVSAVEKKGIDTGILHCSNSGAVFLHQNACFSMIRPGIAVYGYYPDASIQNYVIKNYPHFPGLKPVMELSSIIVQIKSIKKGQYISYGRTWKAQADTRIATIPLGYADGLQRRFAPNVYVTVKGQRFPITGRICMDQCMIDIGLSSNISEGDTAVFFGPDSKSLSAEDYAKAGNTISYEVLCGIGQRVMRSYVY